MSNADLSSIQGWFAGRLPDGWFSGVEVVIEDDQVVVIGSLGDELQGADDAAKESFAAGRIGRFREETRGDRIRIALEAEERFGKFVTWGVKLGGVTKRFTPGGSGRAHGRAGHVVIGRRWGRRHQRGRGPVQTQTF